MNTALFPSAALLFFVPILLLLAVLAFYFFLSLKKREKQIRKDKEESTRRLYELAILKELGERVGYSLNVEEILQIITGSLRQFIDYTAVGYAVITPEKLKINTHLERSVSRPFLDEMKGKMVASLSALTDKSFESVAVDEVISGAIVIDEINQKIGSLFNIPLVIGGKVAGVLTIAHVNAGLYKEEDMTILYKITGQASEAVSRLEEVVKMEKGKLNAMVQSMGDGVLMVDTEYRVMVANPAVKKIIKFVPPVNADGTPGDHHVNVFNFIDALGGKFDIHGRLEEALVKKNSFVSERINIDDSFFEIGVYPVLHTSVKGGDQMLGAVVVFHDISKDIELERVREEFTGMIVHELRSPLDGIKKITELAVAGTVDKNSDQFKEYLNMIYQSSATMLELVNDILDLSKLQAGKFEVKKEKADIKEVVRNRISFFKISADVRNIHLETFLDRNLPESAEFDPQALKQILNNFLSNALKFTSSGGSVLVSAFVYDPPKPLPEDLDRSKAPVFPEPADINIKTASLCVVVSDKGIGIPESNIKDLFHTWKQAKLNPVDKESKGTGLGLVIAKGIAEAHGGTIGVVSREGVGTSFFFTIPLD
jgi:two-component system, NtrC family, sensor histidine kinase KinB